MELSEITPLVLTYNEEANIGRCLERLGWARRVVVIDSGSDDGTLRICAGFPNVEVIQRAFDSFAGQCNFGLLQVETSWVLSMDADYVVPVDFAEHLALLPQGAVGYRFPFRYCIYGHPLRACLYPPRTILYRKGNAVYQDDGHGHRVVIEGTVISMDQRIDHDDRKPLSRWLSSQAKYAKLEADKLLATDGHSGWPDRLRKMIWPAAPAAFLYTLLAKRMILDGWPGWHYALQRSYAELLLSLELLDRKLTKSKP
ncbi:MAG: glycosyltransferase family 2 protein [Verrucomicrobiales bacterium]|nr:glycosyltransferase family 2 protein [Verrucomicrobiales bacterium]